MPTNDTGRDGPGASHIAAVAAQVGAFALANGSKDAALVVTPSAGNDTAPTSSENARTGAPLM